jgi:hypothetical protein
MPSAIKFDSATTALRFSIATQTKTQQHLGMWLWSGGWAATEVREACTTVSDCHLSKVATISMMQPLGEVRSLSQSRS